MQQLNYPADGDTGRTNFDSDTREWLCNWDIAWEWQRSDQFYMKVGSS